MNHGINSLLKTNCGRRNLKQLLEKNEEVFMRDNEFEASQSIKNILNRIKESRNNKEKNYEYITVEEFFYFACEDEQAVQDLIAAGMKESEIDNFKYLLEKYQRGFNRVADKKSEPIRSENLEWAFRSASALAMNINKNIEFTDIIKVIVAEKTDEENQKCKVIRNILLKYKVSFDAVNDLSFSKYKSQEKIPDKNISDHEIVNLSNLSVEIDISKFIIEMTNADNLKNYSKVIGRDIEVEEVIEAMQKKKKSSVLLTGEAGVGKTAIAEGLAIKLANNEIPRLKGYKMFQLNISSMVSGAKYRGDFEQRFEMVMKKIEEEGNCIVFIDEIHMISGAGSTGSGQMDMANLLKPCLSGGKIKLIGATTNEEKRRYIDKDQALIRRFKVVNIEEPTEKDCLYILEKSLPEYEKFYDISYGKNNEEKNELLISIVKLSSRYLTGRKLPDKAFDIIDNAGAIVKNEGRKNVIQQDIENVIAKMANIPVESLSGKENERLLNLEKKLSSVIFGQDEAIESLVSEIMIAKSGIGDNGKKKPLASFMFAGPTGVGKTEIVNELSEILSMPLLRFDMSEYMEKHSVAKLTGAPQGYVGHDDGSALMKKVMENPHTILLFDEFEKAHPDVQNLLLQLLDNGFMTDNKANKVNFRNTIVILTTNAGSAAANKRNIGFGSDAKSEQKIKNENVKKELEKVFKPEFRNRLDHIIYFNGLSEDMSKKITVKKLLNIENDLMEKGVVVKFEDMLINYIANTVFEEDNKMGARPIDRKIKEVVTKKLAIMSVRGDLKHGDFVSIGLDENNELKIKTEKSNKSRINEVLIGLDM